MNNDQPYQVVVICKRCGLKGEADLHGEIVRDTEHDTLRYVIWVPRKCPRCAVLRTNDPE